MKIFTLNPDDSILGYSIEKVDYHEFVLSFDDEKTKVKCILDTDQIIEKIQERKEQVEILKEENRKQVGYFYESEFEADYFAKSEIEKVSYYLWDLATEYDLEDLLNYNIEVWEFGHQYYSSEEAAEAAHFESVEEYDMAENPNACYYNDIDDIIETLADRNYLSMDTVESILKHKDLLNTIQSEQAKQKQDLNKRFEIEYNRQAKFYSSLIEPKQETYKETCFRLHKVLSNQINKRVFHKAVKLIRIK